MYCLPCDASVSDPHWCPDEDYSDDDIDMRNWTDPDDGDLDERPRVPGIPTYRYGGPNED